jgi:hypothetical protein
LKKTYADVQNVIRRSEADNGSFEGWDYTLSMSAFVDKYISPYMPLYPCSKRKIGDRCFDKDLGLWRAGGTGEPQPGIPTVTPKYYTKDGRYWEIYQQYDSHYPMYGITFTVDVNGRTGKSIVSQDVFSFTAVLFQKGESSIIMERGFVSPANWNDATVKKYCFSKRDAGQFCGEWLRRNGWKFPANYPYEVGVRTE